MNVNAEYRDGSEYEGGCIAGSEHDWRLISERTGEVLVGDNEETRHWRRWYCTRCRLVEAWTSGP